MKENLELIKRYFLVAVTHPKGENIVWTCVEDNIMWEKEDCRAIGLHGLDINYLKKRVCGGVIRN